MKTYTPEIKEVSESELQRQCDAFVSREVYYCQSMLVDELLKEQKILTYEDIENFYEYRCPECGYGQASQDDFDNGSNDDDHPKYKCPDCEAELDNLPDSEPQEIFEWWLVSDWLADKLAEKGHPVIKQGIGKGTWWGRCTTGQAIALEGGHKVKTNGKLMASSHSLDGITKLIGEFYYSKNIRLININPNYYQVYNLNGKIETARVLKKKNRYRFEIEEEEDTK